MEQHLINPPEQVEIIRGVQQTQNIIEAQPRGFETEIKVRTWLLSPHSPRAEQPRAVHLRLSGASLAAVPGC